MAYGAAARLTLAPPAPARTADGWRSRMTGRAFRPSEMERVFEPFHRLETSRNRETGGVGLGLPIARNILRAHGGDVVLRNRPGGGLVALATLPG